MLKRISDIFFSLIGILLFFLPGLLIALAIKLDDGGDVFFRQRRVGKLGKQFNLYKFRTMNPHSEKKGQITIGEKDPRITGIGRFLRRTKLDEIPQLLNVLKGEMSMVGPRPEVPHYVAMYSEQQMKVLRVRPGLTDPASIEFINENEILGNSDDPERAYAQEILPAKLSLNLEYIDRSSFWYDLKLIFKTIGKILS